MLHYPNPTAAYFLGAQIFRAPSSFISCALTHPLCPVFSSVVSLIACPSLHWFFHSASVPYHHSCAGHSVSLVFANISLSISSLYLCVLGKSVRSHLRFPDCKHLSLLTQSSSCCLFCVQAPRTAIGASCIRVSNSKVSSRMNIFARAASAFKIGETRLISNYPLPAASQNPFMCVSCSPMVVSFLSVVLLQLDNDCSRCCAAKVTLHDVNSGSGFRLSAVNPTC